MKSCLFVVPSLSDGGAERVVSVLSSELTRHVDKVFVLVYWDTDFNYLVDSNVSIINLSEGDKYSYQHMNRIQRILIMRRIIRDTNPEVVIPFLPQVCLQVGIATLGMKCKVIQTVRNNPSTSPTNMFRRFIRNIQIACSKCTIVQNEEQLMYFPKRWRKHISILPNPIHPDFLKAEYQGSVKFDVVAVGRLIEQKNYQMLIEAFSHFAKNHADATLSIYGDGALKEQLQRQISNNGMNQQICLKGRTNRIHEVLMRSSLFVMSSDFEGMPNSLMEAMAVGIPVISTDCPTGPKELIGNNERGYLVEVGNRDQMEEMFEDVYKDIDTAVRKAQKAKIYVSQKYAPEAIARLLLAICK